MEIPESHSRNFFRIFEVIMRTKTLERREKVVKDLNVSFKGSQKQYAKRKLT